MKLASLKGGRDGRLVVVSNDLSRYVGAEQVADTLQEALDNWAEAEPALAELAASLEDGAGEGFDPADCKAPATARLPVGRRLRLR